MSIEQLNNDIDPKKLPSPSDILGNKKKVSKLPSPSDILGDTAEKKNSVGNGQNTELASEPKNGSSVGKGSSGFPKIDTNSVAPGVGVQPKAETAISPSKKVEKKAVVAPVEKEYDFIDSLVDNLDSGIATISKSFYDAPALVYDAAASLSNPLVKALGGKANRSEDFAKTFGLRNIPAEVLKVKIDRTNKDIQDYNDKNGGNAFEAVSNGNYLGAAKMIAGTTMQSLPLMAAAMATGGSTASMIAISGSTASTKASQLKDENPEMDVATRTTNAAFSGLLEAYVGHLLNGASGAVVKKIIADKGTEVGSKLISKSIKSVIEKNIEKNPLIGLFGEVAEESVVELGNQASDMASGIRTEFDIKAIANAGLSATGMGGINTVAVYGAKGYVKAVDYKKAKSVNKEISKLSNELTNGSLSDADREIIKSKIARLSDSNKKLIKDSVEKADALPINVKDELGTIESSIDNLKGQILDIQDNSDIANETKKALIAEIQDQGKELIARKNKVIDGNYMYDDFEQLPQKEKNKLKDEASRALLAEAQKGGKENATFEDAEISKKAAELHNEKLKQDAKAKIEAEQEAVVDTPSEVVSELENKPNENPLLEQKSTIKEEIAVETPLNEQIFDFSSKTNEELEKRQSELEDAKSFTKERQEFAEIEKELEKREWQSVLNESLDNIPNVINGLIKKEKEMPNGYGSYIEKRDARETKEIAEKYSSEVSKAEAKKDFSDAFHGNPDTWYADALKLRESVRAFSEQGGTFKELLRGIENEFAADGFSEQDAAGVIKMKLDKIRKVNEATPSQDIVPNGEVRPTTSIVEENAGQQGNNAEILPKPSDIGKSEGDVEVAKKSVTLQEDATPEANFDDVADFLMKNFINKPTDEKGTTDTKSDQGADEKGVSKNNPTPKRAKKEVKPLVKTAEGKLSRKGKTPLQKRRFRGDRKTATNIEPTDVAGLVLRYFIDGGQISKQAILDLYKGNNNEFSARTKIGGYAFEKVYDKKGNILTLDELANDIWERKGNVETSTSEIKDALENAINSNNRIADMVGAYIKSNNQEIQDNPADIQLEYEAKQEVQEQLKASDEEMQSAEDVFDHLTDEEIIRLADNKKMGYADFIADLEKRAVTYDLGPFKDEKGTIQNDGTIVSETGDILSPESVSNVQFVNKSKAKAEKPLNSIELNDINKQLDKATDALRAAKEALDRKAKALDKELLKDNENLFGERKSKDANKLFDERVDEKARNKATETERKKVKDAQSEVKRLTDAKAKIEAGDANVTPQIEFGEKQQEIVKIESEKVEVYHGTTKDKNFKGRTKQIFTSTDNKLAKEYSKNLSGKVVSFFIDKKSITTEKEALKTISKLRLKNKDGNLIDVEDGSFYEMIDERFNDYYYIGEENRNLLYNELAKKGFTSIRFTDTNPNTGKNIESILIFDPSKVIEEKKTLTKEQKKQAVNEEVDKLFDKFKKALPKGGDGSENIQGIGQDQLLDFVADSVKALISKGIDIDEAVREVIQSIKTKFNIDIDEQKVREKINPTVENEVSQEPKSKPKADSKKQGGLDEKQTKFFSDLIDEKPDPSGNMNTYSSGITIEREHSPTNNNQNYEIQKDLSRAKVALFALEHAKTLFGAQYLEKTLEFVRNANLNPQNKAAMYVILENEMDARTKEFPNNVGIQKLQNIVRAESQEFLANSARAIGAGRFRTEKFRELVKKGFSEDEFTDILLTKQQRKDKKAIQDLIEVSPDDVNAEAESQEGDTEFEIVESRSKTKRSKSIVKKELGDVFAAMRKDLLRVAKGGAVLASIPYAAQIAAVAPHALKASKLLIELGGMSVKEIVNEIHSNIKDIFPDVSKEDIVDILTENQRKKKEGTKPKKTTAEKKIESSKETVKKALIEKGFGREITVTINERDANGELAKDEKGRNVKVKEVRQILDWKKLAGEAGTIENIKKNVEEALLDSGMSKSEIEAMQDNLAKEYERLSADIIEKGLNELQRRNTPRKLVNTKSAAKKLAELYNYGLFSKNKDSYERIINSVLGFSDLDQKTFDEMKDLATGYESLLSSGNSETATKDAINSISKKQSKLIAKLAISQSNGYFKAQTALKEIMGLSTRFKLVNLGNLAENMSSGIMARVTNRFIDGIANIATGEKTSTKALRKQSTINATSKLKGISLEAAESYGDTSSMLLNHSVVEDYLNKSTTSKTYHGLISAYMAKPFLEGADSFNKLLITEAKLIKATLKVLQAKGMKNSEALDYVSKALTGESMQDAIVKAKELIESVNKDAKKKILNDSESSVKSLAADIVKDALVTGGQITPIELKKIYNAAYKSAGKDIGHVSNNFITTGISTVGRNLESRLEKAISEKQWNTAGNLVLAQNVWQNVISTFVGGGTNWFVKGAQKSGFNPIGWVSIADDVNHLKLAGELDVTSDEGIKNMEEVLYRSMNLRSTIGSVVAGSVLSAVVGSVLMASGGDDELDEWLKNNKWAKKYADKLMPDVVVLILALKNKDYRRYFQKLANVKSDFFDEQKQIAKIFQNYAEGVDESDAYKTSKASGDLGVMLGKRFDFPGPLKIAKDFKRISKGLSNGEVDEVDYYANGYLNGYFQGGLFEGIGMRPDPAFKKREKNDFYSVQKARKEKSLLTVDQKVVAKTESKMTRLEGKVREIEHMIEAYEKKVPYYYSNGESISVEELSKMDMTAYKKTIIDAKIQIAKAKKEAGIKDDKK